MTIDGGAHVVLVTGASRGIGAATARAFAAAGASVVLVARDAQRLATVRDEIAAAGGTAIALPADVSESGATEAMVGRAVGEFGRLDVAVNAAAAHGSRPRPLAEVPPDEFDAAITVTLRGTFLSMRSEIPAMIATGGGAIVNVASTAGLRSLAGLAGYVAAKRALIGLTESAALDYAAQGVRINAIAPGPIHTEQLDRAGAAAREHVARAVPAKRLGTVDEVAAAIRWLCAPEAAFVTGSTLVIDGGLLAGTPTFA
ncbi:SDR family NAD(P)-dependent oxidoreductase [Paractinoplanes rhizophilus]|uniref:SDR family NAD(P)-dependent oxidoreductase n=1 Tax=Paractinoplanes rhizophilus TaxID=1416877 RepID=A0ABW2I5J5_9ACTN